VSDFDHATRQQIDLLVEHLNARHADTVLFAARDLEPGALDATLASVDRAGAVLTVRNVDGDTTVRLPFAQDAADAYDVRQHVIAAIDAARLRADPAVPLTSFEAELRATAALPTVHGFVRHLHALTPSIIEVTVAGLYDYPLGGGDEFVYVMVSPEPGGIPPSYRMADFREQAAGDLVHGAYYTVRRSRPDAGEVDLWVVEHDHPGSVAEWMRNAEPGAPIAFWGPRRGFEIPQEVRDVVLIADETGLAAVAALIEAAAPTQEIVAVLESVGAHHRPPMPQHPNLRIVWVDRGDDAPGTVNRLLDAVRAEVNEGRVVPGAAFGAAESRQISAIRRYLRAEVGLAASVVSMTGYWRLDG
jgi:NADPH-dependent ferric siderophore reductase